MALTFIYLAVMYLLNLILLYLEIEEFGLTKRDMEKKELRCLFFKLLIFELPFFLLLLIFYLILFNVWQTWYSIFTASFLSMTLLSGLDKYRGVYMSYFSKKQYIKLYQYNFRVNKDLQMIEQKIQELTYSLPMKNKKYLSFLFYFDLLHWKEDRFLQEIESYYQLLKTNNQHLHSFRMIYCYNIYIHFPTILRFLVTDNLTKKNQDILLNYLDNIAKELLIELYEKRKEEIELGQAGQLKTEKELLEEIQLDFQIYQKNKKRKEGQ